MFNEESKKEDNDEINSVLEKDVTIDEVLKEDKKEDKKEAGKTKYFKEITEMIVYILIVLAIVGFIYNYVGQRVEVSGVSMERTLDDKDHLILEKLSYRFGDPKRFDIIVFRPYINNKDIYYIKRIIGLPGETVQILGSDIYINGIKLEESYGKEAIVDGGNAKELVTLGDDEYFAMGDNRNNSKDSRFTDVGNVHRDAIMGRVLLRIWPLRSFELLKHQ